jgi:uncharacterized protein (DUF433 family)
MRASPVTTLQQTPHPTDSEKTTTERTDIGLAQSTSNWGKSARLLGIQVHLGDWKDRIYLPTYQVKAAASFAGVTAATVRNWQKESDAGAALGFRERGVSLSYMQLQELAIVSAMRKLGVKLPLIRLARDWLAQQFQTTFPFADERVKCDGQDVLVTMKDKLPASGIETLLVANRGGQMAWAEIIGKKFDQFEYERGVALKWHLSEDRRIILDPRIAFGAPAVKGVPTWVMRGREKAGESVDQIAVDFRLRPEDVKAALVFEHTLH